MTERPIGRDVVARQRFARIFSLGDRRDPCSWTPALILSDSDPELPVSIAPLSSTRSKDELPSEFRVSTRANLCFPFDSKDDWYFQEGLLLPPSLVESNSGKSGQGIEVFPVSWNSLHHDDTLNSLDYQPSVIVVTDAPQLSNSKGDLERALLTIRNRFPASLIWTPGISGPDNCALLAWMGVDIFDLTRSRQASSMGVLLSQSGPRKIEVTTGEQSSMDEQCLEWTKAISATRSAIRDGSLRELAERQSTSSPRSVEHLRIHDEMAIALAEGIGIFSSSVNPERKLQCHSYESRNDPLVREWRKRIRDEYLPPIHQREILVLLPCSAKKPYRLSQSHHRFRRVIKDLRAHEVMVTAPLGLVPRELEDLWPAVNYDIPVTGKWDRDELFVIRDMVKSLVERTGYSVVINHSGVEIEFSDLEIIDTRMGNSAGSKEALGLLKSAVESAISSSETDTKSINLRIESLKSVSRFVHKSDKWLNGAQVSGRPPILTISRKGEQMAKWNPKIGRFSFSKSVLKILSEDNTLSKVEISEDIDWIGDIFPSYVKSHDKKILNGDELLIYQNDELIGSARACAPGWEWPHGPGRLAKARHRLGKKDDSQAQSS